MSRFLLPLIKKNLLDYHAMSGISGRLGIHNGDCCHVDDIIDIVTALQYMNRFVHAHQDRADRIRAAQVVEQLVADIPRTEFREYQYVCR